MRASVVRGKPIRAPQVCPPPNRRERPADCCFAPTTDPRRPDPAIYSQREILQRGLPTRLTWNSPDINTNWVQPMRLTPDAVIFVRNLSAVASAANVRVDVFVYRFGIGFPREQIGGALLSIAPAAQATINAPFPQRIISGEQRVGIEVQVTHPTDSDAGNNVGHQAFEWVSTSEVGTDSGVSFPFGIRHRQRRRSRSTPAPVDAGLTATLPPPGPTFGPLDGCAQQGSWSPGGVTREATFMAVDAAGALIDGVTSWWTVDRCREMSLQVHVRAVRDAARSARRSDRRCHHSKPACAGSTQCGAGAVPLRAVPVAAALLFVVALALSLFILVFMERLVLAQVLWPTAANAAVVILVVVTIVSRLPASRLSMLIGWLIGALVGWLIGTLLCWFSCRADPVARWRHVGHRATTMRPLPRSRGRASPRTNNPMDRLGNRDRLRRRFGHLVQRKGRLVLREVCCHQRHNRGPRPCIGGRSARRLRDRARHRGRGTDRLKARPGINRCYSGIVNGIRLAYRSAEDWAFPYAAQHHRVNIVVKRALLAAHQRSTCGLRVVRYGHARVAVDPQLLPFTAGQGRRPRSARRGRCRRNRSRSCGYFAGVAVAAAIGTAACAASLWFYLLCLLVVVVVALVVALVLTLISATVGGAIGAGVSGSSGAPAPATGGSAAPVAISVDQYITLNANLTVYGEDNDAWVGWWVDETTAPPVLHGVSVAGEGPGGGAPFNFVDADGGFTDACPI